MKAVKALLLIVVILTSLACSTAEIFSKPTPTPMPTSTDTPTITPTITPTFTNTQTPSITPSPTLIPIQAITRDDGTILVLDERNGYQFSMPAWWSTVEISESSLSCKGRAEYHIYGLTRYYYYDLNVHPRPIDIDMSLTTILTNEVAEPEYLVDADTGFAIWMFEYVDDIDLNPVVVNYGQMTTDRGTPLAFVEFYYYGVAKSGPGYLSRGYNIYFIPVENLLVQISFYKTGDKTFNSDDQQLIRTIRDTIELIEP